MFERQNFFARFLTRFVINGAAIFVASILIPGIHLQGWEAILFVTIIFGLINAFLKPVVKLATCLIYVITFGLFTFIINAGMLYLTAWLTHKLGIAFSIDNFLSAFLGALIVSLVSFVLSKLLGV